MGREPGWAAVATGRPPMRSPGRPPVARKEHRGLFWSAVARGMTSTDSGLEAGVSEVVGTRWFRRECGGVTPQAVFHVDSGRYLSFVEREQIALLPSSRRVLSRWRRLQMVHHRRGHRELRRNAGTRGGTLTYRATVAQWHRDRSAARPQAGENGRQPAVTPICAGPSGWPIDHRGRCDGGWPGRVVHWAQPCPTRRPEVGSGLESGADRGPVAGRLPDDPTMRISHEAIYQALYIEGRGALAREHVACLRTGRALRVPRARTRRARRNQRGFITPEVTIDRRPAEVTDRDVPGHWEGDLIIGLNQSAIGTLVERVARYTILLPLPRMPEYGTQERAKNGPALAGHGADAVKNAIIEAVAFLPEKLRRTLTWDRGTEMAEHAEIALQTGLSVFFCDPHSPWQRGTNENTNGLLRQYFPKGTDLSRYNPEQLAAVAYTLNTRTRKVLDWKTPDEALQSVLYSRNRIGVATIRLNPPSAPKSGCGLPRLEFVWTSPICQ